MTEEALLRLTLKRGRAKLKTGQRRHIWTTSLVPRLIIAWAVPTGGLPLRTPLYALSFPAAGCEPQWESLKFFFLWGAWAVVSEVGRSLVQHIFRSQWAQRVSASGRLEAPGHPGACGSWQVWHHGCCLLSSIWKGSSDCWGMACVGAIGLSIFNRGEQKFSLLGVSAVFCVW